MIPYLLLLLLPSCFAMFNSRRLSLPLWYVTLFIYVIFVGLRNEVGPDWHQYSEIHKALGQLSIWEVLTQAEPLSHVLFWFSETNGADTHISNLVAAIIMMVGVSSFARRTANPWLALLSATPYFIIVMGMSGVRQAMAASIVLYLFSQWERYSFIKRGLYILVAAMFHTSALINNIFLIIKLNIALRYKLFLGALVFLLTLYLGFGVSMYAENIERYQDRYLGGEDNIRSIGSLYHIAMIATPALFGFLFRKRIAQQIHNPALLRFGLYAAVSVLAINFFSSTAASRLTVYLYFVPMMVYPALATTRDSRTQLSNVFAIIAIHYAILIGWFQLANVSFAYIPYLNLLFDG